MTPRETLEHMEKKMEVDLLNVFHQEINNFIKANPKDDFNVELEEYDRGNCLATSLGESFNYDKHQNFSSFIDKWCRMASKLNMLDVDDTIKYESGKLTIELRWHPSKELEAPKKSAKNKQSRFGISISKKMM